MRHKSHSRQKSNQQGAVGALVLEGYRRAGLGKSKNSWPKGFAPVKFKAGIAMA